MMNVTEKLIKSATDEGIKRIIWKWASCLRLAGVRGDMQDVTYRSLI